MGIKTKKKRKTIYTIINLDTNASFVWDKLDVNTLSYYRQHPTKYKIRTSKKLI